MKIIKISALIGLLAAACAPARAQDFRINQKEYFENAGAGVMVFSDVYSEGHQGGVTLVLNGHRHAANGDVRFEVSQGQWQGLPRRRSRTVDTQAREIRVVQSYPDSSKHLAGFNPSLYPDFAFEYTVAVRAEGDHLVLTVDLERRQARQILELFVYLQVDEKPVV